MKNLRTILAATVIALLSVGYGMSQLAFFNGLSAEYAKKVDTPAVSSLALLVLIVALVSAFWRDTDQEPSE